MQDLMNARKPPALNQRQDLAVNRAGKESIYWPLYDFLTYDGAGQAELSFFQNPIGQANKTLADTNMTSSGQLPANQSFIITGISYSFHNSSDPSNVGVIQPKNFVNDAYNVMRSGYARLFIGSKDYMQIAPIGALPSKFRLSGFAALSDASTSADALQNTSLGYASSAGAEHLIAPLDIPSNQNFNLSLHWPTPQPLNALSGRIGIYLHGWLTRNSQ